MLILKLLLVPSLIALITLAGRRWGPAIAGWLSGFPVVAGPILLLVALEHGPLFGADAAAAALSAVLATVCFSVAYSWLALRWRWWVCALGGLSAYALVVSALNFFAPSAYAALTVTLAWLWIAPRAFPRHQPAKVMARPAAVELPARMLAGAVLVLAVTFFAESLGPRMSGLFSVFPVIGLVLGVFSHVGSGAGFAIRLLSSMVAGFYAFSIFCFSLALALPVFGTGGGFLIALAGAVLVQGLSFKIKYAAGAAVPERR